MRDPEQLAEEFADALASAYRESPFEVLPLVEAFQKRLRGKGVPLVLVRGQRFDEEKAA